MATTEILPRLLLLTLLLASVRTGASEILRHAADLVLPSQEDKAAQLPFDVEGDVIFVSRSRHSYVLRDDSGHITLKIPAGHGSSDLPGCRVRATGHLQIEPYLGSCLCSTNVQIIARRPVPEAPEFSASDIRLGKATGQTVRLRGMISDICPDDLDPRFTLVTVISGTDSIGCSTGEVLLPEIATYLGAEVTVRGFCDRFPRGHRHFMGPILLISDKSDIEIRRPPPADPFDAPSLDGEVGIAPRDILVLGRRTATGRVLAAWGRTHVLLRLEMDAISLVELSVPGDLPTCGEMIDASGFPDTDLYNLNLSRAIWRPSKRQVKTIDYQPSETSAEKLLFDPQGRKCVPIRMHGRPIRLRGTIVSISHVEDGLGRLMLQNGPHLVPVDFSALSAPPADLSDGCTLEVTGVCLMELPSPSPGKLVPGIDGFTVIVQRPEDIRILSRPSWWTPSRLLLLIGILAAVLCGILVWNLMLRRAAERQGAKLAKESIARIAANLRVGERTRLAVELHDTLVQNMTGVAIALRTHHYDLAAKTLDFCRKDLRNCLWDLRNLTLDDADINAAIRKTLAPHTAGVRLQVRFSVPREKFTDNTTHAILCILRELAINAVRHGGATALWVAGSTEGDLLLFSVRDNGCGFDPDTVPGVEQGHFGLQGIRDRVDGFEGTLTVESSPSNGTKITVALNMSRLDDTKLT